MTQTAPRPVMGNLIRGLRFFYLLWGGMLLGTLDGEQPDPPARPALALDLAGAASSSPRWGGGWCWGSPPAMTLAALAEVWELVDRVLARFFHDAERDH